jgi:hypothetical protein
MKRKYLYEIGDLVKVRDDIDRNMQYRMRSGPKARCEPGTVYHIGKYRGSVHKIIAYDEGYYKIDNDPDCLFWSDEMFEPMSVNECICDSLL